MLVGASTTGSDSMLVSGSTVVPCSYGELRDFFFAEDPARPTESFRRLMTTCDPLTKDVLHVRQCRVPLWCGDLFLPSRHTYQSTARTLLACLHSQALPLECRL